MEQVIEQFGLNWKLLLSQGVNFAILLFVLTRFVYRPLLALMEERRAKITFGLKGAEEVERRLGEIENMKTAKMVEADKEALEMIRGAEREAGTRVSTIMFDAQKKVEAMKLEQKLIMERQQKEEMDRVMHEAQQLIKEAFIKTVELAPEKIDEKLVRDALTKLKAQKAL